MAITPAWAIINNRNWPPGDKFKEDRDARIWFNSNFTPSDRLMEACSYFLSQGWPTEALEDFLGAIEPRGGWYSAREVAQAGGYHEPTPTRRPSHQYGPEWNALQYGYWEKKK